MALNNHFYSEIIEKETYWTELSKKNLLNFYYINCRDGIKEFYTKKRIELSKEYEITKNPMQEQFLKIIINILQKIETLSSEYRSGKDIDINSLVNIFMSNQMNNNLNNEESTENDYRSPVSNVSARKKILESMRDMYATPDKHNYEYDDFDFEQNNKGKK